MSTAALPSLMDDQEFLAELEALESTPIRRRSAQQRREEQGTMDQLENRLAVALPEPSRESRWVSDERAVNFYIPDGSDTDAAYATPGAVAWPAAAFVILLGFSTGAGAAAFVFQDKVALILR